MRNSVPNTYGYRDSHRDPATTDANCYCYCDSHSHSGNHSDAFLEPQPNARSGPGA